MKKSLLFVLLLTQPAFGADAPSCNSSNQGIVHCFESKMCECIYERGGLMTNKRAGFRWDCGINRPSCIDPNVKALTAPYDGPQAVGIDKSTSSTTINNNP